jgi:hypothetical protein
VARKTLNQIVAEKPFHDFADWWRMGQTFLDFMAEAIVSQWLELAGNTGDLQGVKGDAAEYLRVVYRRQARADLVETFATKRFTSSIESGEFDALSYAFFKSAYKLIEQQLEAYEQPLEIERRLFTKRVGKIFFGSLQRHLNLDLPDRLEDAQSFARLKEALQRVGDFLKAQGYLRDHFAFSFAVDVTHGGGRIVQRDREFIETLRRNKVAYALYEMGYPAILPSAVYLYHTVGEAQHHSSRIIEELFERVGYQARETDDFDPTAYPSDRVVELWEIKPLLA